jgi:disulfide bond formation protein DsbB
MMHRIEVSGSRTRHRKVLLLGAAVSFLALSISLSTEFLGLAKPCFLCQLQRIPYAAVLVLAVIGFSTRQEVRTSKWCAAFFAIGVILSLYHLGVQIEWLTDHCATKATARSITSFKATLFSSRDSGCRKIGLTLLGIPASLWNTAASSIGAWTSRAPYLSTFDQSP